MQIDTTKVIAWWGAILSSTVFAWDIYKWGSSGPKIRLSVETNMKTINHPLFDGQTLMIATASNNGPDTTITNLGFLYFPTLISWIRRKPRKGFVSSNPSPAQPLPFLLTQGGHWQGMTTQSAEIEEMLRSGRLYCNLYCSHSNRPISVRVPYRPNPRLNSGPA